MFTHTAENNNYYILFEVGIKKIIVLISSTYSGSTYPDYSQRKSDYLKHTLISEPPPPSTNATDVVV